MGHLQTLDSTSLNGRVEELSDGGRVTQMIFVFKYMDPFVVVHLH